MIHITHIKELTVEDASELRTFATSLPATTIEYLPESYPFVWRDTGRGTFSELAWIVFAFAGAGGALLLKSFFQQVGTELGKQFVDYWFKRRNDAKALTHPCAVIYEMRPGLVIVIPLVSSTTPGFDHLHDVLESIERADVQSSGPAQFKAVFDSETNQWMLKEYEVVFNKRTNTTAAGKSSINEAAKNDPAKPA